MMYNCYSVYDRVSGCYGSPVVHHNDDCAVRWFSKVSQCDEYAQPTDFELYCVGTFDVCSGVICPNSDLKPRFICKGRVIDNV